MRGVFAEFAAVQSQWRIWHIMALQDILMRYRRSLIGPFWISLSMGAMVFGVAILFSQIYNMEFKELLAWIAVSFLIWGMVATCLTEGSSALVEAEAHLRSVRLSTPLLAARVVWRNIIVFAHNLIVIFIVLLIAGTQVNYTIFFAIPGLVVICLFSHFSIVVLAPLHLRFRDIGQIVGSVVQIMFFVTPVIWMPGQGRVAGIWLDLNPLYHLLELVRAPLLGTPPTIENWVWGLGCTFVVGLISMVVVAFSRRKVYLWL